MRKEDVAEAILSLANSRERVASIAGDLVEEFEASGSLLFWFVVVRTALSQMFGQFVAAPFSLAGAAIRGMFVEWGYLLLVCIIPATVICCQVNYGWFQGAGWAAAATPAAYLLTYAVVPFLLGRWMSRGYAARGGAASLTLSAFHATINLCFGLIFWQTVRLLGGEGLVAITFAKLEFIFWDDRIYRTLVVTLFYLTGYPILLLAGALSARQLEPSQRFRTQ